MRKGVATSHLSVFRDAFLEFVCLFCQARTRAWTLGWRERLLVARRVIEEEGRGRAAGKRKRQVRVLQAAEKEYWQKNKSMEQTNLPETPPYTRETLEEMTGLNETRGHYSIRERAQKQYLVDSIIRSKLLDAEARAAILRKHEAFSASKTARTSRATRTPRGRDRRGERRSRTRPEKDVAAEQKDDRVDTTTTTVRDDKVCIPVEDVRVETRCSICMGIIKRTKTVTPCLHRYESD